MSQRLNFIPSEALVELYIGFSSKSQISKIYSKWTNFPLWSYARAEVKKLPYSIFGFLAFEMHLSGLRSCYILNRNGTFSLEVRQLIIKNQLYFTGMFSSEFLELFALELWNIAVKSNIDEESWQFELNEAGIIFYAPKVVTIEAPEGWVKASL